jgi:hypothetical protein
MNITLKANNSFLHLNKAMDFMKVKCLQLSYFQLVKKNTPSMINKLLKQLVVRRRKSRDLEKGHTLKLLVARSQERAFIVHLLKCLEATRNLSLRKMLLCTWP